uniref:Phosphatidylcholine transfer protein n=1 Tax=Equus caballus TaxID=9796 RepID=A0A5F5PI95_HORSE
MARAAGGFREEQFWEACAELKQPKLAGANWELLMEAMGICVYRLWDQDTRVYKYKVFGTLKNCPPALLTDVYMDLDYRKQWDQHVEGRFLGHGKGGHQKIQAYILAIKEQERGFHFHISGSHSPSFGSQRLSMDHVLITCGQLYERECNGQTVVYWQVKCPMLKPNRDYVYVRERRDLDVEGRKVFVVLAQSISHSQFPERSGVVRVTQCEHRLAITSDGRNGSKVFMYYFDNLRVQIPTWLLKRALKNGVPEFLNNLEKACRNYPRRY